MIDWETFKNQLQTNPGKLLKSVMLLAGCFLVIWILVVLQSNSSPQNNVRVGKSGQIDSLSLANRQSQSVPSTAENQGFTNENDDQYGSPSMLPVALFFLVALGGVWLWIRSKNSSGRSSDAGPLFTTVGSQQLPGGQQLVVIKMNEEYWVMTTGGTQGMKLLHRYEAGEWLGPAPEPGKASNGDWKQTLLNSINKTTKAETGRRN